jgi:hypothetical protein
MTWNEYDWNWKGAPFPLDYSRPRPLDLIAGERLALILGIEMWLSDPAGPQNAQPLPDHSHRYVSRYHHNGGEPGFENETVECVICGSVKSRRYIYRDAN